MTLAMVGPVFTKQLGSMGADIMHVEAYETVRPISGVPLNIRSVSIMSEEFLDQDITREVTNDLRQARRRR